MAALVAGRRRIVLPQQIDDDGRRRWDRADLVPGVPEPLFEGIYDEWFDIMPDGSFVMMTRQLAELSEIQVVLNWSEELKRNVPTN